MERVLLHAMMKAYRFRYASADVHQILKVHTAIAKLYMIHCSTGSQCSSSSSGFSGGTSYRQGRALALPFSFGLYVGAYHWARKPIKIPKSIILLS